MFILLAFGLTACSTFKLSSVPESSMLQAHVISASAEGGRGGGVFPIWISYVVETNEGQKVRLYDIDYGQSDFPKVGKLCNFKLIKRKLTTDPVAGKRPRRGQPVAVINNFSCLNAD